MSDDDHEFKEVDPISPKSAWKQFFFAKFPEAPGRPRRPDKSIGSMITQDYS